MVYIRLATGMATLPLFEDVTVYDEIEPCPYLSDRSARLPLQVPCQPVGMSETDKRLALGQRRTGEFVYVTKCPKCNACEPIRLPVRAIRFSKTHRRTMNRNNERLTPYIGPILSDAQRVNLFNRHRNERGLGRDTRIDREEYTWAFQRSCFDSFEISFSISGAVCAVAICDQGEDSLSAVYTFFDPDLGKLSLGTYSLLKQIEYCLQTNRSYLYLGFYIAQSRHMAYKANFLPHERYLNGKWVEFK